jgi:crossover junction endodeoxyribonuclease RuvC
MALSVKIIGIDPGLAYTGIGIIQGQGQKILQYAYGAVRTGASEPQAQRLEKIYRRLQTLFQEEKPDLLIVEDVFSLDKYPQSGITLGKVCGIILLAGQQVGVSAHEIPVREAKQVLTGNGNASKEQLEKAVRRLLGCNQPIRPFHASDALGLALIGLFRYADFC